MLDMAHPQGGQRTQWGELLLGWLWGEGEAGSPKQAVPVVPHCLEICRGLGLPGGVSGN